MTDIPLSARRLVAILAIDVVGYSRLVGDDEAGALEDLRALRTNVIEPAISRNAGRLFKIMGDGFLVEFPSAVAAMTCALEIQIETEKRAEGLEAEKRMRLRAGLHVGDVVADDGDLLGDGVNIAARLESIAPVGGIAMSRAAHDQVSDRVKAKFIDGGEIALKNINRAIHVFVVASPIFPEELSLAGALKNDRPSIAVLPFSNISSDPDQEYFADGIVEDIIAALSRVRWFFVIARNSTFAYKGKRPTIAQVARELGVRYVLEGSVRKSGGRIRIAAELVDVRDNRPVWADRFDGDMADIFELQDRVTAGIVGAIEPSLQVAEITRARSKPPSSLTAYDLYLRALFTLNVVSKESYRIGEDLLFQALVIDPDFVDALVLLAQTVGQGALAGWRSVPLAMSLGEALEMTRRATQIDPSHPVALAARAFAEAVYRGSYEESAEHAERALRLNPNSATVRRSCGIAYAYGGACEAAIQNFEAALQLSPLDIHAHRIFSGLAMAHFFARNFAEVERNAQRVLQESPNHVVIRRYLAPALAYQGKLAEAHGVVVDLLRLAPDSSLERARGSRFRHPWQMDLYIEGLRMAGLPESTSTLEEQVDKRS
ncbi:MAG: adenylate/guanylate cyclase domain-containing protein [Beijerinckiaceae bacterium]